MGEKTWTEVSKYVVRVIDGEYSCTCRGFFYKEHCKHIAIAKEILNDTQTLQGNSRNTKHCEEQK